MPGFSPPTLWCVLIVALGPPFALTLSITSGYSVPCTRNAAPFPASAAASSNTSMNVCPMIVRFFSGSASPGQRAHEALLGPAP